MICSAVEAWCSGLTCSPVKAETAGSNPVASVDTSQSMPLRVIPVAASLLSILTSFEERCSFRRRDDGNSCLVLGYGLRRKLSCEVITFLTSRCLPCQTDLGDEHGHPLPDDKGI